jgi:hypothetical protein
MTSGPRMTAYYPVISRAIAALKENTVSSRCALYERARAAQIAQLRRLEPPLVKTDFDRECLALEDAIRTVEEETIKSVAPLKRQTKAAIEIKSVTKVDEIKSATTAESSTSSHSDKRSTVQKIMAVLSNTTVTITGIAIIGLFVVIPSVFIHGGAWVSAEALDYLAWPVDIASMFCILIFVPLSLFRATRPVSAVGFMASSYIFGASTLLSGMLVSYIYFGIFWTVIALFFFFVGVVPLAILGAVVHADWMVAGLLTSALVLTYGARGVAVWMTAKIAEDQDSNLRHAAL